MTLDPEFDGSVVEYSATTSNAEETVTAVARDEDAEVSIKVGETIGDSGDSFDLEVGLNEIEITVTNGSEVKVYTVNVTREADNTLSALSIGNLTLSPTFDKDVTEYTAETTNATNTVTATPTDLTATVVIMNGETPIESGSPATWEDGENTLTITVNSAKTYTVVVTKN